MSSYIHYDFSFYVYLRTVEVGCFASAQVVVPNSQQISCLDGSFLECSLPTREARVRSPAGTCQSRDLKICIEMTLVMVLYKW